MPRPDKTAPRPKMSKDTFTVLGRVIKFMFRDYKIHFFIVVVCIIVQAVTTLIGMTYMKTLIDEYISPMVKEKLAAEKAGVEYIADYSKLALSLGTDYAYNPMETTAAEVCKANGLRGINAVIECVGRPNTMQDAINAASRGGHVLMFGLTSPDCEIPLKPYDVFQRELTITSSFVNPFTQGRAAELVNSGKLHLKELISDRIPLEEIHRAFEIGGRNGKMMIFP